MEVCQYGKREFGQGGWVYKIHVKIITKKCWGFVVVVLFLFFKREISFRRENVIYPE